MTLRTFTLDEVRELYLQHTVETGQVFEPGCAERAFAYSGGQPYLVNALAKWCVDEIHDRRYGETVTLADFHEAKEKIIREGWLVVLDPDLAKPWDGKICREDLERDGRRIHIFCC